MIQLKKRARWQIDATATVKSFLAHWGPLFGTGIASIPKKNPPELYSVSRIIVLKFKALVK